MTDIAEEPKVPVVVEDEEVAAGAVGKNLIDIVSSSLTGPNNRWAVAAPPPEDGETSNESDDLKKQKPEAQDEEGEELTPEWRIKMILGLKYAATLLLVVYLLAAFIIDFKRAKALFTITILVVVYQGWLYWAGRNEEMVQGWEDKTVGFLERSDTDRKTGLSLCAVLFGIVVVIMAATVRDAYNLISLLGLIVFLGLTWMFSWKPTKIKLRPVVGGFFIQFIFGYCVIRTQWGFNAIEFLSEIFITLLGYTTAGSSFVYAWLTDGSLFGRPFQLADGSSYSLGPPFFFNVLPSVIFFSSLMSVGYYIGALPWMVRKLGYFLALLLGTSASESLSAAGNIFVGQTEAPLLVKPFMPTMTESELHAIMTGGFSTIAGSVFGVYVSFGADASAILAASVMSAPAALAISKIALPETEDSPTATGKKGAYDIPESDDKNVVHAATNGAVVGMMLVMNIAANLIAFLAIIEMLDQLLIYLGNRVDLDLSFNTICEYVFWPAAWLMGVNVDDCKEVARLIGLKIFANEFVAYGELSGLKGQISERSFYIATYALCGFSNFGSVGIQLGGLTPLAPNQGEKLAKLVMSAMIAGNTACFMTACIAGLFFEEPDV